jgi:CHAD domain-containing protein
VERKTTASEGAGLGKPMATPSGEQSDRPAIGLPHISKTSSLDSLLATRLRKFVSQLPKVLGDEDPEAIHDLRVWSRRLQQVVSAMFPKPRNQQAQAVVETLRQARRAAGTWRDCDVLIELVRRRLKRVRQADERIAWEVVYNYLLARRERAISRARHRLANRRLFSLAQTLKHLVQSATDGPTGTAHHDHPESLTGAAIKESYALWRSALGRASKSLNPADVHAFRVQSKRLRYRLELARDLGAHEAKPALAWLRNLQDALGRLQDSRELARMAAKAMADPDFLLEQPRAASRLLARLAAHRKAEIAETERLLEQVRNAPQLSVLESLLPHRPHKPEHHDDTVAHDPAPPPLKVAGEVAGR